MRADGQSSTRAGWGARAVVAVSKASRGEGLGLPLHRGGVQPPACMPCCSSVPSVPSTNVSSSAVTATVSTRFHVPTRCQSGAHGSLWETSAQPSGICFSSPFLFSLTADNCKYSVPIELQCSHQTPAVPPGSAQLRRPLLDGGKDTREVHCSARSQIFP